MRAGLNKALILGNLGHDPSIRKDSGTTVATLDIATSRRTKQGDETEWHRVILFGRAAEIAEQYLRKGDAAYVEGRMRTRSYTDKKGIERWITEIIGDTITLMGSPRRDDQQGAQASQSRQAAQTRDDDPPF